MFVAVIFYNERNNLNLRMIIILRMTERSCLLLVVLYRVHFFFSLLIIYFYYQRLSYAFLFQEPGPRFVSRWEVVCKRHFVYFDAPAR